jgi:hypothetical protein
LRAVDVPVGPEPKGLSPVLRELRGLGLTELIEDPDGEILALRLTRRSEREMAARVGR